MIFFYLDVTAFHGVPLTPLFSIMQHHEKRWGSPPHMRDVITEQPLMAIFILFYVSLLSASLQPLELLNCSWGPLNVEIYVPGDSDFCIWYLWIKHFREKIEIV